MKSSLLNQSKRNSWLGGLQVQVGNSLFYVNIISTSMAILTFWYTAGYQIHDRYAQWFTLWLFIGVVILAMAVLMVLDFKYVYPSRQAFVNEQACKHDNPAMDLMEATLKEVQELRAEVKALKGLK